MLISDHKCPRMSLPLIKRGKQMSQVKVKDAVSAFKTALAKLEQLDQEATVLGGFDEGGYTDMSSPLIQMSFSVNHFEDEEQVVEVVANFYS